MTRPRSTSESSDNSNNQCDNEVTILHTENYDVTILLSDDKPYKGNGNEVTILQQEIEKVSILNCKTETSLQHTEIDEMTQLTH